jgi:hypothetical protein
LTREGAACTLDAPMKRSGPRSWLAYAAYMLAVTLCGGYVLSLGVRSLDAYNFLKSDHRGFKGKVHRADPELGFAAVPASQGWHVFPIGPPLPMRYNADELRVPAGDAAASPRRRPFVLALGCSFTYGDACLAEDTFPYRVAQGLGGTALNAGKCAYGLSQMLILARRLVPRYKPEYVLVQFSPWLVGRGTSGFARSTFGLVPVPYLTLADGRVGLQPPCFRAQVFDLPFPRFDNKTRGLGEFLSFFFTAGAPLFVHDDASVAVYKARRLSGGMADAERRRASVEGEDVNRLVYREIAQICKDNAATMVLVRLSHPLERHHQELKELYRDVVYVDAQAVLDASVPRSDPDAYYRRFAHWRGTPPVLVDTHPNPEAHGIIAREILSRLPAR